MADRFTFAENADRDVPLVYASIVHGWEALCALAMHLPDFKGGPDAVDAWGRWISHPNRRAYRESLRRRLERYPGRETPVDGSSVPPGQRDSPPEP